MPNTPSQRRRGGSISRRADQLAPNVGSPPHEERPIPLPAPPDKQKSRQRSQSLPTAHDARPLRTASPSATAALPSCESNNRICQVKGCPKSGIQQAKFREFETHMRCHIPPWDRESSNGPLFKCCFCVYWINDTSLKLHVIYLIPSPKSPDCGILQEKGHLERGEKIGWTQLTLNWTNKGLRSRWDPPAASATRNSRGVSAHRNTPERSLDPLPERKHRTSTGRGQSRSRSRRSSASPTNAMPSAPTRGRSTSWSSTRVTASDATTAMPGLQPISGGQPEPLAPPKSGTRPHALPVDAAGRSNTLLLGPWGRQPQNVAPSDAEPGWYCHKPGCYKPFQNWPNQHALGMHMRHEPHWTI